jgi:3-dehydroquinate synthase
MGTFEEERVGVALGPRSYEIRITSGRAEDFGQFVRHALQRRGSGRACRLAVIVADEQVSGWMGALARSLDGVGIRAGRVVVPSGEGSKCLAQVSLLYDAFLDQGADRQTVVVAFGGGVIGDLAGFAAATFLRGLPLVMVPTTLLAQVDSSVGGKVGVNHPRGKNLIGAFHQPAGVWIDTAYLATLPERAWRCGLAEVVKYGMILDGEFFESLESQVEAIRARQPGVVRHLIARSCELKARVVEQDEREETGLRAVLNFGHTVGHAIEAEVGYGGRYEHGEAVALGMVLESRVAERLGWIGSDVTARLERLLERLGLPTRMEAGIAAERLLAAMGRDKKNKEGKIHATLPRRLGHVELTDRATEEDWLAVLGSGSEGGA